MKKISFSGLKIYLLFLVPSLIWVFFSDLILFKRILPRDNTYIFYDNLKDATFVITISLVLYFFFKHSADRLRSSQQQYFMLFEKNPNPMLIVDSSSKKIVAVNETAVLMYQYSHEEFSALPIEQLVREDDRAAFSEIFTGTPGMQIWKLVNKEGKEIMVQLTSNHVVFEKKKCRLIMLNDITGMMRDRAKIESQYDQLRQVAFATSHNMRAPLTNIMALARMASQKDFISDDLFIRDLLVSAEKMDLVLHEIVLKSNTTVHLN